MAVWDKFGMPNYGIGRYTQLSYVYGTAGLTWWYDDEKAAKVAEARKNKGDIGGDKGVVVHDFWRNFNDAK
jgi:hypothetical protein